MYLDEAVVNDDGDDEGGSVGVEGEGGGQVDLCGVGVEQQDQWGGRLLRTHDDGTRKI